MKPESSKGLKTRLSLISLGMQLLFVLLIARLFIIQFVLGPQLRERSANQTKVTIKQENKRGKITDRNQNILAVNHDKLDIYVDPKVIKATPKNLAKQLVPILSVPEEKLIRALKKKNRRFVRLKKKLDYSQIENIKNLERKHYGLSHTIRGERIYPKDQLACHIIGSTNFMNTGIDGIEHSYNSILSSTTSTETGLKIDQGKHLRQPEKVYKNSPKSNDTIILTIDEYIQNIAESILEQGCAKWKCPRGTAIVMRTMTGEILAMANYPNYNLNQHTKAPETSKRNNAIWMQYEPGSIFKIVTTIAVLNEGIHTPNSEFYCDNGEITLPNGHVIRDVKKNATLTLSEIVQKSSNIGIMKAARHLPHVKFQDYVSRFKFGQRTEIDLPYERTGSLWGLRVWDEHLSATVPFGQGISVTPLQMLCAINTVATGGRLMQPYIMLQRLTHDNKIIVQSKPKIRGWVMSPETAKTMKAILVGVTESGSGIRAQIDGYSVAGKTGTSQKALKGTGYIRGKVVNSFAGFLPAENPQISIIVVLDEPVSAPLSSVSVAPMFQKIAEQTMRYLNQTKLIAQAKTQMN